MSHPLPAQGTPHPIPCFLMMTVIHLLPLLLWTMMGETLAIEWATNQANSGGYIIENGEV